MQLDAIGIISKDLGKSIAFYGQLGLKFSAPLAYTCGEFASVPLGRSISGRET